MTGRAPSDGTTIVARATSAGRGGISIVRVSGPDVKAIAKAILGKVPRARHADFTAFLDADEEQIDSGIALFFQAPHSFTGEDILELQGHGGVQVAELLIERILELGARPAEPGEFSRRAFLNDKIDLSQAEAIADLIDSRSKTAARAAQRSLQGQFSASVVALNEQITQLRIHVEAAIDFPDEDIDFLSDESLLSRLQDVEQHFNKLERSIRHGCLLRDGVHIVLAGRPNAGKSSLLNVLTGSDTAIVTATPGTTRDLVKEDIELDGLPVHIVDTAGLRTARGEVEQEGIRRTLEQLKLADHALVIVDAGEGDQSSIDELVSQLPADLDYTVVRNKIDLTGEKSGQRKAKPPVFCISARSGDGVDALREHLKQSVGFISSAEGTITARQRHLDLLRVARKHFDAGKIQLLENQAGELMAEELLQVQNALANITGEFSSDDLLGKIFGSFCIGK